MKSRPVYLIAAFVLLSSTAGLAQRLQPKTKVDRQTVNRLEQTIPRLMTAGDIPGLSIALIGDSKVIWSRGFGVANSEKTKSPVDQTTVFEAASLTKPVFAYAILKLVDSGKLDLDTPLTKYLPGRYDVGDDPRLDQITTRRVLSHTTGLPNWRPRGAPTLKIHFAPGDRFNYSGEGFVYLSRVVEHITGEPLEAFIKKTVLDPLDMKSSNFVWRDDYESLKTFNHNLVGAVSGRRKPDKPNAASSLHTTANDYAKFVLAILKGTGLKPASTRLMLTPQVSVTLAGANSLNSPEAKLSPNISWGLGWGLEKTEAGMAFWHWGDNGDTKAFVMAFEEEKTGLVMFANSSNGLSILYEIVSAAFGGEHPVLAWIRIERYDSPARLMLQAILKSDAETVLSDYRQRRSQSDKLQLVDGDEKPTQGDGKTVNSSTAKSKDQSPKTINSETKSKDQSPKTINSETKSKDQSPKTNNTHPEDNTILTEAQMNRLGYQLLGLKRLKDAIEVFKQNTVDFPEGFNTWDSLAEGYMVSGDKESAIKYYKKSLELNPDNTNAVEKLKELAASPQ